MKKPLSNPFPVSGYHGPVYFCDREKEVLALSRAVAGNRNVTLVSPRRVGKTALIYHFFGLLPGQKNRLLIYADLLPTGNLNEFAARLATALARACPDSGTTGKKIWSWIRSIRPLISFDPFTGLPQISFDFRRPQEQESTIHQLLSLLENSGKQILLVLDEFQQILQYPEHRTEAWLRSEIQNLQHINIIFSGSRQQLMGEMFNSAKRPFYASTQMIPLPMLEKTTYHGFIARHMSEASVSIQNEDIDFILDWCRLHTFYVQTLCNRVFTGSDNKIGREIINEQIEMIFEELEDQFFTYRELLTGSQWSLLRAIAKEEMVFTPTAGAFIRKYDLGTPAAVKRSLESLMKKEMIFRQFDNDYRGYYQVYDVFLSRWLELQQ